MRQALVLGTGGHCRVVLSLLADAGQHRVLQILELGEPRHGERIMGTLVTPTTSCLDEFRGRRDVDIFLAIGNNGIRKEWWQKVKELDLPSPNLISPHAIVDRFAILGEANVICARAFIGPECRIGDNNLINTGAIVEHEVQIGSHCHLAPSSTVAGRSRIDDECFVGAGATVIHGVAIATGTTLGAGSVLISSIDQPNSVYVGVPAQSRAVKI